MSSLILGRAAYETSWDAQPINTHTQQPIKLIHVCFK